VSVTIEIKQLVIRAAVRASPDRPVGTAAPSPLPSPPPPRAEAAPRAELDALVAECTRRVLRELRKRRGR
jgi:hypothetical protein